MNTPYSISELRTPASGAICLTDSPAVVELKNEFFQLDARTEDLKQILYGTRSIPDQLEAARTEYHTILDRKAAIGAQIFGQRFGAQTKSTT